MNWLGAGIGALLGARGGLVSMVLGAALGSWAEERIRRACGRRPEAAAGTGGDPEAEGPYATLGCRPSDSDAAVRAAYRELAKRLHPDRLRAEGLSEERLRRANDEMARINAAWDEIRRRRGL